MPLVLIAIAAFLLRVAGVVGPGPLGAATGYDDGVYFSASALLLRGVLPYRDFVFVHPPGILYFLALTSWLPDPATGFAAARVLACVVGGINTFLIGRIVARTTGTFGGLAAAVLYGIYPDVVTAERSAYLEPFLNLAVLAAVYAWLNEKPRLAGALAGLACAVKFWGGIWVVAAVAAGPKRFRFIAAAAIAGVILLAPIALPAPSDFVQQTLGFQLSRPPDGTLDKVVRLREMFGSGHLATSILAAIGFAVSVWRRRTSLGTRSMPLFAIAFVLTVAGFLASSSYWSHYNSHLAVSQCALAGIGAAALVQWRREMVAAVALLIALLDIRQMRRAGAAPQQLAIARSVPTIVPSDASLFSFDPTELLVARRLPPRDAPVVVDSYGAMLLEAKGRFPDSATAFKSNPRPSIVRERLARSDYTLLGWRGNWQLNDGDRRWFAANFACVNPEAGDLCIWQRRAQPLANPPAIEEQLIHFGDGWYDAEASWRWMGARSVTTLPGGPARLTLQLDAPTERPTIAVEIDGRVIDRFVATSRNVTRDYAIDGRTLVISTSRTFKAPPDTRELGLSLTGLTWRRAGGGGASTSSPR